MLAAVCFGVLLLAAVQSVWQEDFSPGEELVSPGAKDIAVSQEDKVYPTSDRLRFDEGPEVVYVYLRVEDFATYEDLEARVGRTSRSSAFGRLLGGRGELVVSKEGEERLTVTYGEASGVVKFAVRPGSEGRLPSGNYTVAVYGASGGAGENSVVARKYFVVGARHGYSSSAFGIQWMAI
ncbi:MAG TPA: hypothetical protein VK902_17315 [Rubrobacter sp.]|nr:hypothetical protein [Rubrobacter sp.]